jgi:uncharacterized protein (DUF2147 family)
MSVRALMLAGTVAISGLFAPAQAAESPLGVWIDDTGRGAVEISECGAGKLCGKLVWLQDEKNSKACGTAIIGDVAREGDGWDNGWIYSPENDSKYDVALTPVGADKLTVLGYAGTKLFSREMTWTRAPADLKRCDLQEAKAGGAVAPGPEVKRNDTAGATSPPSTDGRTQTADATAASATTNEAPVAAPAAKPKKKVVSRRRDICRVEAPFVTVDFPCDDD